MCVSPLFAFIKITFLSFPIQDLLLKCIRCFICKYKDLSALWVTKSFLEGRSQGLQLSSCPACKRICKARVQHCHEASSYLLAGGYPSHICTGRFYQTSEKFLYVCLPLHLLSTVTVKKKKKQVLILRVCFLLSGTVAWRVGNGNRMEHPISNWKHAWHTVGLQEIDIFLIGNVFHGLGKIGGGECL